MTLGEACAVSPVVSAVASLVESCQFLMRVFCYGVISHTQCHSYYPPLSVGSASVQYLLNGFIFYFSFVTCTNKNIAVQSNLQLMQVQSKYTCYYVRTKIMKKKNVLKM